MGDDAAPRRAGGEAAAKSSDDTLTYERLRAIADVEPGTFSEVDFMQAARREECSVLQRLAAMIDAGLIEGTPARAATSKFRDGLIAVNVRRLTPSGLGLLEQWTDA